MEYVIHKGYKTATVVTPTIGSRHLRQCIESIEAQKTKYDVEHLLVFDGVDVPMIPDDVHILRLPWNVGRHGFYGHRVYAAIVRVGHDFQLVTKRYCFLNSYNNIPKFQIKETVRASSNHF